MAGPEYPPPFPPKASLTLTSAFTHCSPPGPRNPVLVFAEGSLCTHWARLVAESVSHLPSRQSCEVGAVVIPILQVRNRDTERLSNLPKVAQPASGGAGSLAPETMLVTAELSFSLMSPDWPFWAVDV